MLLTGIRPLGVVKNTRSFGGSEGELKRGLKVPRGNFSNSGRSQDSGAGYLSVLQPRGSAPFPFAARQVFVLSAPSQATPYPGDRLKLELRRHRGVEKRGVAPATLGGSRSWERRAVRLSAPAALRSPRNGRAFFCVGPLPSTGAGAYTPLGRRLQRRP